MNSNGHNQLPAPPPIVRADSGQSFSAHAHALHDRPPQSGDELQLRLGMRLSDLHLEHDVELVVCDVEAMLGALPGGRPALAKVRAVVPSVLGVGGCGRHACGFGEQAPVRYTTASHNLISTLVVHITKSVVAFLNSSGGVVYIGKCCFPTIATWGGLEP